MPRSRLLLKKKIENDATQNDSLQSNQTQDRLSHLSFITVVQPTNQPACSSNTQCFIGFIGGMSASFARRYSTYLDSFQALSMTHYIFSAVPTE